MPHLIYEITDNLDTAEADIPGLLKKSNQVLIDQGGVFPTGGIRSRVIWLKDYCVADGAQSVILNQVTYGIAIRMAVMATLGGGTGATL